MATFGSQSIITTSRSITRSACFRVKRFNNCVWIALSTHVRSQLVFCNNFQRGTGGGIGAVQLNYTNSGAFKTSGIDAQLDWNFDLGPGRFGLNTVFNYLINLDSSPFYSGVPDASRTPFRDYADTFAAPDSGLNTAGAYRYKLLTNVNYSYEKFGIGVQWQHLPSIRSGSTNTGYPSYDVFNLSGSYSITDDINIRLGVDNVFDRAPVFGNANPLANPAAFQLTGGGLNTNNYDALGRRAYFGANLKF